MTRCIPASGINLFQLIYLLIREVEDKTSLPALNLSLGNPDTVPPREVLELQARHAADPALLLHTYAEDNDIGGFAESMIELHTGVRPGDHPHLDCVPIPGIKTAGALIPLACGLHLPDRGRRAIFRVASNLPAYDVIGTWTTAYLAAERIVWPLLPSSGMRLEVKELERALDEQGKERVDLVYVIRPGNPAAVGATASEWKDLIEHCLERGTRLVNDAAYVGLAGEHHVSLARVACEYPDLEWIEMVSVSKSFSDPGARLGALVGSRDFVEDFRLVKGNTESGPVPYVMKAYADFLAGGDAARRALAERKELYDRRLSYLVDKLTLSGLRPACQTDAGFFTLWKVPRRALGVSLADDPRTRDLPPHEAFNRLVISETGIVGVHFQGPTETGGATPLIRYGVCTDVLAPDFQKRFERELQRLQPGY